MVVENHDARRLLDSLEERWLCRGVAAIVTAEARRNARRVGMVVVQRTSDTVALTGYRSFL